MKMSQRLYLAIMFLGLGLSTHFAQADETKIADTVVAQAVIDGSKVQNMDQLYESLAQQLGFPSYYQKNMAAVFKALVEINDDTEIYIKDGDKLERTMGRQNMKNLMTTLNTARQVDNTMADMKNGHRLDVWYWK